MPHDGKYIPLDIALGINKDDTPYKAEGRWVDSEKIRFNLDRVEKYPGWNRRSPFEVVTGVARDIHIWKELRDIPHYAVGTHEKLEIEQLGTIYDITPIVGSVSSDNILSTTSGATSVVVSVSGHNQVTGNYVLFTSVSTTVGGISFSGNSYQITTVEDNNSFVIETNTTATATSASDGGVVSLEYLLPVGRQSNGVSYGWGAGTYGTPGATASSGYGDPRGGSGVEVNLRQWSLDNWGEDIVACPRGGAVYYWDASTSVETRASAIDTVPASNNVVFVHPNRHLVLLGTWPVGTSSIDPLEIRWSDRDDPRNFSVSAGTRAGTFRLQGTGNEIVGYAPSRREHVIFTDDSVWAMRPVNNDLVFGFDQLAVNAGLIAPHAAASVDGVVYWMSFKNFYKYDGRVQNIPNKVDSFVFDNLNFRQKDKIFCGVNKQSDEIMWLYQSTSSTSGDIDRYVKYNWVSNVWDIGSFDRVVWEDSGIYETPIGIDISGQVYAHEQGTDDAGAGMKSYIESSYFDIDNGTDMLVIDQMLPDLRVTGAINFSITTRKWPGGPEVTKGPFSINQNTRYLSFRARGRQAKIRLSTSAAGTDFSLGKSLYRVKPDGER